MVGSSADEASLPVSIQRTRVLVIATEGQANPSTRLRILQYIPALEEKGFAFDTYFVPYGGKIDRGRLEGYLAGADVVFVQRVLDRELLAMLRRAQKPIVFDLDDAIHYIRQSQYPGAVNPQGLGDWLAIGYRKALRGSRFYSSQRRSLGTMIDLSTFVIVGNEWLLRDLALAEDRAVIVPTAVWLSGVPEKAHTPRSRVTLGWIGVQSNLYHLDILHHTFRALGDRFGSDIQLTVVSSTPYRAPIPTRFIPWSLDTEGDAVLTFDVGLMPLQDDLFSRGKCAMKAVFCMSRGIPVVASPVGANAELIDHGSNGYLASAPAEWVECLSALVQDDALRHRLGQQARDTIRRRFAAEQVLPRLETILLQACCPTRQPEHPGSHALTGETNQ